MASTNQAKNFINGPPDGINGLVMREQALGEVNGLTRFQYEVQEVLDALVVELDEQKNKPKEQPSED